MKSLQRKYLFATAILFISLVCSAAMLEATIRWDKKTHDFGKIPQKKKVSYEFKFKNPGMIPLTILNVESTCGCTVPEYSKQPIPPGGEGKIKVVYDAKTLGYYTKTIKVYTNTAKKMTELYIKAEVIAETQK